MTGFVPISEYGMWDSAASEIGYYSAFSVGLSHGGHKRQLLQYRLHGIRVRVLRARRWKKMRERGPKRRGYAG